jgi:protein ImuB
MITAVNRAAQREGIRPGMVAADARVLYPTLEVIDDQPGRGEKLLQALALWCIRYTPVCAAEAPDGLMLDITGCTHLWGGEDKYLGGILGRLKASGYEVRGAVADTVGAAWAVARFGGDDVLHAGGREEWRPGVVVPEAWQVSTLMRLPVEALRLEEDVQARLLKLGLRTIGSVAALPRGALRRRFGVGLLLRLDQAFGAKEENILSVEPVVEYQERLTCLEPICTATGIGIALEKLMEILCGRLERDGKGLRVAVFKGFRIDGKVVAAQIGTNRASTNRGHLIKLFEEKITELEPDLGIELFTLDVPKVEDVSPLQKTLWTGACGIEDIRLAELMDRVSNKLGPGLVHRYLPAEHYWPERSFADAADLIQKAISDWPAERPRPVFLLPRPERIEVAAPIPDYPPMHFRYKNKLHKVVKADGPERIEQEWWICGELHRDYYVVEDDAGARYWLFRSGHYTGDKSSQWYLHGFFA